MFHLSLEKFLYGTTNQFNAASSNKENGIANSNKETSDIQGFVATKACQTPIYFLYSLSSVKIYISQICHYTYHFSLFTGQYDCAVGLLQPAGVSSG